jgi:hypothetical protein
MNPRYSEEVSLKFGRTFLKMYFGNRATIPHGSKVVWLAGVQYVTDQPGVYLVGAAGGMCGVQVIPPATSNMEAA